MSRFVGRLALLVAFVVALAPSGRAEGQGVQASARETKRAKAVKIANSRITIDGRLDEAEWAQAPVATDFVQQQPQEGSITTHRTDIRFMYDEDNLYVGATMYEDEPDKIIINDLRRDFPGARDGDLLVVNFDTFHDRLNAYNFQTNAGCALRDSQSYDDGRNINANFDLVWVCRSSIGENAWYVEFSVPFKQLRFPTVSEQLWGLQVFRLIRHNNEQTMWSPTPRQFFQFKMSFGGELEGIRDVRPGRNIRVKPNVTARSQSLNRVSSNDADAGLDVKIGLGPNFVLDGTYRTDFSQVEADAQQVNLTRFSLFFPERREFFLENLGAFQMGPPTSNFGQGPSNLVPFFTRTIGLSDTGTPIPIVGGLRLTGKAGRNNVAFLNMQTEEEERPSGLSPLPSANFTVARFGREFLSNSLVGGFFMDKSRGGISNRVAGTDLRYYPTRQLIIDAMFMHSTVTNADDGDAWRGGMQYDAGLNQFTLNYTSLSPTFRDDLGFIPRLGVDILNANVLRRVRPRSLSRWIREIRAEAPYARFTRDPVNVETETWAPSVTVEMSESSQFEYNYQFNEEALLNPFRPQGIPAGRAIPVGRYHFRNQVARYSVNNAHRLAPTVEYRVGDFFNGDRTGVTAGGRYRFSPRFSTTVSVGRDMIDLPGGVSFHTTLTSLRIDAAFSTRMFLNAFIQYNSVTNQVLSNIRYNFIHRPLSDLFIVYNETTPTVDGRPPARALTVKFTQLFSF